MKPSFYPVIIDQSFLTSNVLHGASDLEVNGPRVCASPTPPWGQMSAMEFLIFLTQHLAYFHPHLSDT